MRQKRMRVESGLGWWTGIGEIIIQIRLPKGSEDEVICLGNKIV